MHAAGLVGLAALRRSMAALRRRDPRRRTGGQRLRRLAMSIGLLMGLSLVGTAGPAFGQLMEGLSTLTAPFTIQANGRVVGRVVVVGGADAHPPPGYTAGTEYWTWTSGPPWRGAFTLVPSAAVPRYSAYDWQTFPHERFDLSRTVPLPAVALAANDGFYQVQVASGTGWVDQGYLWLDVGSPTVQTWYGVGLTTDLVGNGGPIRFQSVEPPRPGSMDVYLLQ